MELLNQAAYARRHSVSRKAVTQWKTRGWLVFQGDLVDVDASDALIEKYRRTVGKVVTQSVTQSPGNTSQGNKSVPVVVEIAPGETASQAADRLSDNMGWTIDEAKRVKETYLALLNQLEYDTKSGLVVLVADVAKVVGDEYAKVRTRLLAIPAEQAPRVHRLKTVMEVQDVLQGLITDALEELTRDG